MRATLLLLTGLLLTGAVALLGACKREQIYSRPVPPAAASAGAMPAAGPPAFTGRWAASAADCETRPWILTPVELDAPGGMHCTFAKLSPGSAGYGADVACKGGGPDEIGRITLTLSGEGDSRGLTVSGGPFPLPVALAACPPAAQTS